MLILFLSCSVSITVIPLESYSANSNFNKSYSQLSNQDFILKSVDHQTQQSSTLLLLLLGNFNAGDFNKQVIKCLQSKTMMYLMHLFNIFISLLLVIWLHWPFSCSVWIYISKALHRLPYTNQGKTPSGLLCFGLTPIWSSPTLCVLYVYEFPLQMSPIPAH